MKYSVLFCTIASCLAITPALANPKISGTLKAELLADSTHTVEKNLTTNTIIRDEKQDRPTLYGSSRIRLSGSNKINDKVTAAYSLEYDFYLDNNRPDSDGKDGLAFNSRSTYASIEHKDYGRLRYGRMTSPETDFDTAVARSGLWGGAQPFGEFAPRTNNTIQYYSPYFGKDKKTRIKLHYAFDENSSSDRNIRTFVNGKSTTIKRDMAVAQILHNGKNVQWGGSYTQAGDDFNALTGMVGYISKDDKWNTNLVLRQADYNSANKEFSAFATAGYMLNDQWQAYGQVGYSDNYRGNKDSNILNGAVGVAKEIKTSGGRASFFAEMAAEKYDVTTINSSDQSVLREDEIFGVGVGMHYRF